MTGSEELPNGDSDARAGDVGVCRDMVEAVVVFRFLVRGSHSLSRYLAGLEIFLLGRVRGSCGSEIGSLGRTLSFSRVGG
jgi:hypothetical protein